MAVTRKQSIAGPCGVSSTPSSYFSTEQWQAVALHLRLSPRQVDVVQNVIDGLPEDAIATRLDLTTNTVHTHIKRLYRKFEVHDRTSLVAEILLAHLLFERETNKGTRLES